MLNLNRRLLAAGFFGLVVIAVLAVIVLTEITASGIQTAVLRLNKPVTRGQPFTATDADVVQINADPGKFSHMPLNDSRLQGGTYALPLQAGDILRPDDIVPAGGTVSIAITISGSPPINTGDSIDVFTPVSGREILIGHRLTVASGGASALQIEVPLSLEYPWLIISTSGIALHALQATTQIPPGLGTSDPTQALTELATSITGGGPAPGSGASPPAASSPASAVASPSATP